MVLTGIDKERFARALRDAGERQAEGIGMLGEKLLHAALKNYFSGENDLQEQKVGRYVADISGPDGIIEIQTGGFYPLQKKIAAFLPDHRVTVVCPVMRKKKIFWIDPGSGELSGGKKNPKTGRPCDVLPELLYLSEYLDDPSFSLVIFFYDGEEYRRLDGWGGGGKRGAHRAERVPLEPVDLMKIDSSYDCGALLPENCAGGFTAAEFEKMTGFRGRRQWAAIKLLEKTGTLTKRKEGKAYIYTVERREFLDRE